jgi:capsular polysaccharide biosynthesis protein
VGAVPTRGNRDDVTHSSCPGGSGHRVFDVGLRVAPRAASELSRWQRLEAHQSQDDEQSQAKEFKAKMSKIDGRFVLKESSDGGSYGTYLLDDQTTARKYEGQKVVVTGTLDAPHKTIHVRKIEAVA